MINKDGDFERNTGADGKPAQLFQCWRDVVSKSNVGLKTYYQKSHVGKRVHCTVRPYAVQMCTCRPT